MLKGNKEIVFLWKHVHFPCNVFWDPQKYFSSFLYPYDNI